MQDGWNRPGGPDKNSLCGVSEAAVGHAERASAALPVDVRVRLRVLYIAMDLQPSRQSIIILMNRGYTVTHHAGSVLASARLGSGRGVQERATTEKDEEPLYRRKPDLASAETFFAF